MAKNAADEAFSLEELSPFDLFPYALHIVAYEDPKHYKRPFRRYRTLSHAKNARKGLGEFVGGKPVNIFQYSMEHEQWEVVIES